MDIKRLQKLAGIEENKSASKSLMMYSLYTDPKGKWHNEDWPYHDFFKTEGMISKKGFGSNGVGWGKDVILCTSHDGSSPFKGSNKYWKYCVIFKKNINGIYIDDEIHDYGDYPSEEIEEQAADYIEDNGHKGISLEDVHIKFNIPINQNNHPYGNYVLNIKPDEIIKVIKRNK
jgi:hypothetical protein